jgi:hypothetical protein
MRRKEVDKNEVLKVIDNKIDVTKAKAQDSHRLKKYSRAIALELVQEILEEVKNEVSRLFDEKGEGK